METREPDRVNLDGHTFDELLTTALRARDLLAGASALARQQPGALAELVGTARAAVCDLVEGLERGLAVAFERQLTLPGGVCR